MGIFRRSFRITGTATTVSADMEDDYHRFGVDLVHDGEKVVSAHGRALRTPWNTCRLAPNMLSVVEGLPLQAYAADFVRQSNSRAQCTHLYELAAIAGSHALRDVREMEYAAEIPYPIGNEPVRVTLHRDGELFFDWQVRRPSPSDDPHRPEATAGGDEIVSPEPFAGRPLRSLLSWARRELSPEMCDAAYIFRRAIGISAARIMDLDDESIDIAATLFSRKSGDCFTFQPEKLSTTHRSRGSTLDFTAKPSSLLADLH
jgi:hypothetical protein